MMQSPPDATARALQPTKILLGRGMANIAQQISQLLEQALQPLSLQVVDDSARHAGHAGAREGGQSHFTVIIVSEAFAGKNRVARHRLVYDALKPVFDQGLHALAIDAKPPAELS
jgi:BolA protein